MKKTSLKMHKSMNYYFRRDWQLYALMIIPFLFVIVFKFLPYTGLLAAFKNYRIADGIWGSKWAGFDVFEKVFNHRNFLPALRNTIVLNGLDLIFGFPIPIILALILNEIKNKFVKRFSQTLLYLPHFLSWIIIGALAYQLFSENYGIVNGLIKNAGHSPIPFLQDDTWWLITYVLIGVWQTMGWGTIIYLAAITAVNPELYEAAKVDGAGRLKQCIHVTLPCIRSTIVTLLIMNLGRVMGGSFERVNALANKRATEWTTTIPMLIYQWGIESGDLSESTAVGLFQSVIGLLLVLISDFVAKRLGENGLL